MNSLFLSIIVLLFCSLHGLPKSYQNNEIRNMRESETEKFIDQDSRYNIHFLKKNKKKIISVVKDITDKYVATVFQNFSLIDHNKIFIYSGLKYMTNELDSILFLDYGLSYLTKNKIIGDFISINLDDLLYHKIDTYNYCRAMQSTGKKIIYVFAYEQMSKQLLSKEYRQAWQEFFVFLMSFDQAILCISDNGKVINDEFLAFINKLNAFYKEVATVMNKNYLAIAAIQYPGWSESDKLLFLKNTINAFDLNMSEKEFQEYNDIVFHYAASKLHTLFGLLSFLHYQQEMVNQNFSLINNINYCRMLIDSLGDKIEFQYNQKVEKNKIEKEKKSPQENFSADLSEDYLASECYLNDIVGYEKEKQMAKLYIKKVKRVLSGVTKRPRESKKLPHLILYGPPGTGKTVFLKAIANELNINYRIVSPEDIISYLPGESEKNLEALFNEIKKERPILLIFDEGEELFPLRDTHHRGGGIVNSFLKYLDGIKTIDGVSFIISTNDIDSIDQAIMRPGRITQKIYLGLPSKQDRKKIFSAYASEYQISFTDDFLIDDIINNLDGFSGADIKYLLEFIFDYFENKEEDDVKNNQKKIDKNLFTSLLKEFLLQLNTSQNKFSYYPDSGFADIAGYQDIKDELAEYVIELKNQYEKKTKIPGIIFTGAPGVGKTQFAKAIAGEAEVPMIVIDSADIDNKYMGESEKKLKEVIQLAIKNAPSILFIDEIDGLFNKRNIGDDSSSRYNDKLTNLLLSLIDGINDLKGVLIIGTTNNYDALDAALVRPGRLDNKITIDMPNWFDRIEIITYYMKKYNIDFNIGITVEKLAQRLEGFSGAEIKKYFDIIAKKMKKNHTKLVDLVMYAEVYQEMLLGKRKKYNISDKDRKIVLYHEASHGFVQFICYRQGDEIYDFDFFTSVPRANSLGTSWGKEPVVWHAYSKNKFYGHLATLLAGRASEEVFFDMTTSGPSGDLEQIVKTAQKALMTWGMGRKFLYDRDGKDYNDEVNTLIHKEYQNVVAFLKKHKVLIDAIVKYAQNNEIIFADQMECLVENYEKNIGEKVIYNISL